ncbi:MAG: PHP domain-containing protein [Coriobacteriales bacterium]|nr:PHP domain-containing protein [Coriobacteriales bacterium]
MRADLHAHTTASDGTLTPTELVEHALANGLDVIAVTDHDSVEGIAEALEAAEGTPLTVIPGVELSAVHDGRDVHVLGYFVSPTDAHLAGHLADLRTARLARANSIVQALRDSGYEIDIEDVLALTSGAVGRSHVARALVSRGHATSVGDAFDRLLGRGRPFYLGKDVRDPVDVVRVIVEAHGLPVLAHPGVTDVDSAIPPMLEAGLVGIEAHHAEHTPEQRERYTALANELGLLVTGGTDFHGPGAPNPDLGSIDLPDGVASALLARGEALRSEHDGS